MHMVKVKEVSEAVEANAVRLITDAGLLIENARYASAFALGTLALEEVGKAALLRWAAMGLQFPKSKETFHIRKQVAVANLLAAPVAMKYILKNDLLDPLNDRYVNDLASFMATSTEARWMFLTEIGALEKTKHISLYDDHGIPNFDLRAVDVGEPAAASVIAKAILALELLSDDRTMKVAQATFAAGRSYKSTEKRTPSRRQEAT